MAGAARALDTDQRRPGQRTLPFGRWRRHLEKGSAASEGLPEGPYGKIGIAVAANSDRVWALIEAKNGGLYRSDDGGDKWELINPDHRFTQRAWYYMHIVADPKDANTRLHPQRRLSSLHRRRPHLQQDQGAARR